MNLIPYAKNSADIQALVARLNRLEMGELVTYADLSEAIGRDIRSRRYLLATACAHLLKQRKVFACVTNTGMRRLTDSEIVENSLYAFRRIRRMTKRSAMRLTSANWNELSHTERQQHNLHLSVLGAIAHAATPLNMACIEPMCNNNQPNALPTAKVLKLLAS